MYIGSIVDAAALDHIKFFFSYRFNEHFYALLSCLSLQTGHLWSHFTHVVGFAA